MKRSAVPFFAICAVIDFAWGCIKGHSVLAGVAAIVFGLPLTFLLLLVFRALERATKNSDAPHN
jgi:hypothetical protein